MTSPAISRATASAIGLRQEFPKQINSTFVRRAMIPGTLTLSVQPD